MAKKLPTTAEVAPPADAGYTVLARRYRPQTFADLVGQEPIAQALTNAITSDRVAHAYLFTGTRGVGKTSSARILAKALNCVNGPTPTPCNVCDSCVAVTSGDDVDVLEIDGASNRGIDDARDMRSSLQYMPARSRYKIVIIDEVHMLTKEAFNALLKTLEEPPPHVKFILATTDVHKVPITILSRCQRFDFTGIPPAKMLAHLTHVVAAEGIAVERDALDIVVRRSGGSMRDAESLLDQLLAFGGGTLTAEQVHHLLGTAGDERVLAMADAVFSADAAKALDLLDAAVLAGLQLGELVEQLIAYWRDVMVCQFGGVEGKALSVSSSHHPTLLRYGKSHSTDAVLAGLDVLAATRARMQRSNHPRTLVEMALVRLSRLGDLVSLTQLAQEIRQVRLDPRGVAAAPAATPAGPRAAAPATADVKKKPLSDGGDGATPSAPLLEPTAENWPTILRQLAGSAGGILAGQVSQAGTPAISTPNTLVFSYPAVYNKTCEQMSDPERVAKLESALKAITGKAWKAVFETAPDTGEPVAHSEAPARANGRSRASDKEDAERHVLVRRAMERLSATIQRVDPGFGEGDERRQREG